MTAPTQSFPEPRWLVRSNGQGVPHVTPIGDLVDHEENDSCVCGPTVEPVERADGSVGWMSTHHSLDGREAGEGAPPAG